MFHYSSPVVGGGADSNEFSLYLAGLLAVLADEHVADVQDYCK